MRLGRIAYINCYPVYGAIAGGAVTVPAELVTGTPAELNELLVAAELDVSVISAVEYARHADLLRLLPEIGITSDGPVKSVALFSRRTVTELEGRTVLLTASSRTAVALLDLLCRDVWQVRPNMVQARAEATGLGTLARLPHAALLVIGDAALGLEAPDAHPHRYDLGSEGECWARPPVLFPGWAGRPEAEPAAVHLLHAALLASRAWGLAHLPALAAEAHTATGVPLADCLAYFEGLY